jgi:hypothetical protein
MYHPNRIALTVEPALLDALRDYADALQVPVSRSIIFLLREVQGELGARARLARSFRSGNMDQFKADAADLVRTTDPL